MFKYKRHVLCSISILLALACGSGSIAPMPVQAQEQTALQDTPQAIRKTLPKQEELDDWNKPLLFKDEANFEFVDQREIISNPMSAPYNSSVSLALVYGDSSSSFAYYGNAFIVSDHTLLTSAHCLYDHENNGGYVQRIDITFADGTTISSANESMDIVISKNYAVNGNEEEDLGIIETDINLSQYGQPLKLASPSFNRQNVEMFGYTSDMSSTTSHVDGRALVKSKGWIEKMNSSLLFLSVYGVAGQSGSPVVANNKAIGIFNFGLVDYSTMEIIETGGVPFLSKQLYWLSTYANYINDPIYRAYNPNSGEHVYTKSYAELMNIVQAGWKDEGMAWMESTLQDGQAVWRLYNPHSGDHHYTVDEHEYIELSKIGWIQEGKIWTAPLNSTKNVQAVYRLYNPHAISGAHHFTTDAKERNDLVQLGWKDEGIAFYAF